MLQAMFSGVSGLQAHQTRLNVIGNNIANVNTIGFKAGRVTFEDQLSQTLRAASSPGASIGGQNPAQIGLGVSLGAVDTLQTQGNLQTTGKATDLSIQGNGFFLVSNGDSVLYTRDGSFDLDSNGIMVNPSNGLKLLGYVADTSGVIDTSKTVSSKSIISIPVGSLTSVKETSQSTFQGNLSASAALQSTKVIMSGSLDSSTIPPPITATVYDSGGNSHTIKVTLSNPTKNVGPLPNAKQRWDVDVLIDGVSRPTQFLYERSGAFQFENPPGTSLGAGLVQNIAGSGTSPSFPITLDFSRMINTSSLSSQTNGQGGTLNPVQSTIFSLNGNLNLDSTPAPISVTAYNVVAGVATAYDMNVTFSSPTFNPAPGPGVPTGATAVWNISIDETSPSAINLYNGSASNQSQVYYVPGQGFITADSGGNSLGSVINLTQSAGVNSTNLGQQPTNGFNLTLDLSKMTTTKASGTGDGLSGPPSPVWNTSMNVYDSLGIKHEMNFKFTRTLVGTGAPANATGRWEWQVSENGVVLTDSTKAGNNALFFDAQGGLIKKNLQQISITPASGAAPFTITADFSTLSQLANTASSVTAGSQDGFPVGTLQTFSIGQDGLITGIFANGQSRTLGQIATASFLNPAGLEKLGQNLFRDSNNSGLAQVGLADAQGRGKISTGFVEMSNVDLSNEFTNLIVTQRGFQANTRIVSIVDDLLQDVINLKR